MLTIEKLRDLFMSKPLFPTLRAFPTRKKQKYRKLSKSDDFYQSRQ